MRSTLEWRCQAPQPGSQAFQPDASTIKYKKFVLEADIKNIFDSLNLVSNLIQLNRNLSIFFKITVEEHHGQVIQVQVQATSLFN